MDVPNDKDFKTLLLKIKENLGIDFSQYRLPCIKRRIESRIRFNHLGNYQEYACFLENNPIEFEQLLKTITIHLTEFFRDKSAWRIIQQKVIPAIVHQKSIENDRNINVWSAGTASGEEAYTLAMLFHTFLSQQNMRFSLNVYGTDIDNDSLKKAMQGSYLEKNMHSVPRKILKDYFNYDGTHYHVNDQIRRLVKFKYNDLTTSEPEISMDLIVCRNVLIYFNRELQLKILDGFSKLLKNGGFLMLGKTESVAYKAQPNLNVFNTKERIYRLLK